jgi:hypothetical protein
MDTQRTFSLREAQRMLPELRALLLSAKDQLDELASKVETANKIYEQCSQDLDSLKPTKSKVKELRAQRARFQQAIDDLSLAQQQYIDCLSTWIERISAEGVILRDIRTGLLDFPARDGHFEYFLCWRLEEKDIGYWHQVNDGFVGRRPLAVLAEYV